MKKGTKKQFCIHGHNISITGRYKDGSCQECRKLRDKKLYIYHPLAPKQFCPKGHDTFICGRDKISHCRQCRAEYMFNYNKIYNEIHRDELAVRAKLYHQKNLSKIRKRENTHVLKKLKTDQLYKLRFHLRCRLRAAIKNNQKKGSAVKDLGCTIEFLKQYIESKFYSDMTWDNWGTVWELDHIIPLWKFDLTERDQFLKAVNYINLQSLTIEDHRIKSSYEGIERIKLL